MGEAAKMKVFRAGIEDYNAHLRECARCRRGPFYMCTYGKALERLLVAVMYDIVWEGVDCDKPNREG